MNGFVVEIPAARFGAVDDQPVAQAADQVPRILNQHFRRRSSVFFRQPRRCSGFIEQLGGGRGLVISIAVKVMDQGLVPDGGLRNCIDDD